jgi:fibronectin-binding autotransporter adhesin
MKRFTVLAMTALAITALSRTASATTKYWDVNGSEAGATPGGNGIGDGAWDTTNTNWNTNAAGTGTTTTWAEGDDAVFAAGSDLSNDPTLAGALIGGGGAHTPASVTFEEGFVGFTTASTLSMGVNPITIKTGATLALFNQSAITAAAGQAVTIDGGKFENYIVGAGSTFYAAATNTQWLVTSNGGTIYTPNSGTPNPSADTDSASYSIMAYGNNTNALSTIGLAPSTATAVLHKTGHGEFRPFNSTNLSGWIVDAGLLRCPSGSNDAAFGAATGTITVAGGAVENTTSGAAVGTTANLTSDTGGAGPSPATRSWVLTGVGATLDSTFVTNANWQILGNISGAGGLMLNGWARTDGGPATGSAVIGAQNELRLAGTNSYAGGTTINFGTLVAQNGSAIPNNSRVSFSTRSDWGSAGKTTTFNTAALRVEASETIGSLSGGNATRGSVNISGPAVTLTTGADGTTSTYSGAITGTGSLAKTGSGTFTMDGTKSYTGNTSVSGGILSTNSATLADAADVLLTSGSTFNLAFSGADTIRSLLINGVAQAIGSWGGAGSGAANISALLSGTGTLNVTSAGVAPGVAGDYNGNGVVDMADYVLWRNGGPLQNEGSTPGSVDASDYDYWRTHFGNTSGSGSGLGSGSAVPEPGSLMLLVIAAAAAVARRNR